LAIADAWDGEKRLFDYIFNNNNYSKEVRPNIDSSKPVVVNLDLELRQLKDLVG